MTKKAADTSTTDSISNQAIDKAKKQFFSGLFDLSWRLAVAFLVPVGIGVWLDSKRALDSALFTMLGILLGVIGSVFIIKKIVDELSRGGRSK